MEKNVTRREIRKHTCKRCGGIGSMQEEIRTRCATCLGKGWVENTAGDESLCPECDGHGYVHKQILVPCNDCAGKGYSIAIVELTPRAQTCSQCEGIGFNIEYILCARCDGIGVVDNELQEERACSKCRGMGSVEKKFRCDACQGSGKIISFDEKDVTPNLEEGPV